MKKTIRFYFECENGRRWSECGWPETKSIKVKMVDRSTGDKCCFNGCLENHNVKLVKIAYDNGVDEHKWFRTYDKWENTEIYKSLLD